MESNYYFNFEDLKVYQKAIEFGELVNKQIEKFPKYEIFKLSAQFIRAVDSIAFNISEGSGSSDAKLWALFENGMGQRARMCSCIH